MSQFFGHLKKNSANDRKKKQQRQTELTQHQVLALLELKSFRISGSDLQKLRIYMCARVIAKNKNAEPCRLIPRKLTANLIAANLVHCTRRKRSESNKKMCIKRWNVQPLDIIKTMSTSFGKSKGAVISLRRYRC